MDSDSKIIQETLLKVTGGTSAILSRTQLIQIFSELGLSGEGQLDEILAASDAVVSNDSVDVAKVINWCCKSSEDISHTRLSRVRNGFTDKGRSIYANLLSCENCSFNQEKIKECNDMAKYIAQEEHGVSDPALSFMSAAQPKLLKTPKIATLEEIADATGQVSDAVKVAIAEAAGVTVLLAQDSSMSATAKGLLEMCSDEEPLVGNAVVDVAMASDWLNTLPWLEKPALPKTMDRLLIYVGTPGKYAAMCIRSDADEFDSAYAESRLVVLCKGVCMCPVEGAEKNIFGVDEGAVLQTIATELQAKGPCAWGHGAGTKASLMERAYGCREPCDLPKPLDLSAGDSTPLGYLSEYVKFSNLLKIARPDLPIVNYYDTGLTVSALMGAVVAGGWSLLTDGDCLAMLRDASIGHIISKLNQVVAISPLSQTKSIYNFFIGDGACRLNGGAELALHIIEGLKAKSMITLFIFNDYKWTIEDNIVGNVEDDVEEITEREHSLHNASFYDLLAHHDRICICEDELELRTTLQHLTTKAGDYLVGNEPAGLSLVVVRGINLELPPVLGDMEPIRKSNELAVMQSVLGEFASECKHKVPLYGCSAFEYISFLHVFLEETTVGKKYQYCCGRTEIQAAHMSGFQQPEGRCVLFINDVYGINSLGETLRMVLSGFGGKQLLVMIWHPSMVKAIDNFHLHRPPMVWPSLGPTLCQYYVRKETEALFVDIEGPGPTTEQVIKAIASGTPLIVMNMMPSVWMWQKKTEAPR